MTKILIASFDMEIGGVERSLTSMLEQFDDENYHIDLMLYRHRGDLMPFIPQKVHLLEEMSAYRTFRMPISQVFKSGKIFIGIARLLAKVRANMASEEENGYKQMQYMWKYALPFLSGIEKEYEIAISYLWPHYFVAEKVKAKKKIAWIHTDYSTVKTNKKLDVKMWAQFDYLIAVSNECKRAFIKQYPTLHEKVLVMENIISSTFIKNHAKEIIDGPFSHDKRFKIVTVARLSHAKGIDQAVEALDLLKQWGFHHIVWYVVGYGGDEVKIKQLIKKYKLDDCFILLGKKLNPYPFIKGADIYVQPSRYEGKAVTVQEAQILERPVLITNYPTAKSQLKDGFDGIICEQSIQGIADGIERLYENKNLRESLSLNCKKSNNTNENPLNKLYELIKGKGHN